MRTVLMVATLVAVTAPVGAQERLADQLRKGIVEEETSRNLDKAIQAYQSVVARYDEDRKVAGTALFRLAECYRKAGKREQAITTYQRVVREFADQAAIVDTSHEQLAALGAADAREVRPTRAPLLKRAAVVAGRAERPRKAAPDWRATPEPALASADRPADSLAATRIEIDAVQKELARAQRLVEIGMMAPADVQALQVRMERLHERARQQEAEILLNRQMSESVQKEISLVQQRIAAIEKNVNVGAASPQDAELLQLRRDLLALQRKLQQLQADVKR